MDEIDDVQLWLLDLDAAPSEAELNSLSESEQARAARFVFAQDRSRYVAMHGALRQILSARTGRPAASLQFQAGPFGKPGLLGMPTCSFNLSDSQSVGLIGLSSRGEIGVDVEVLREIPDALALSAENFTPAEHSTLSDASGRERDVLFLWGWTRKEACLKAVGSGLSIRPDTFEVGLNPGCRAVAVPTASSVINVRVQSFRHGSTALGSLAQIV